MISDLLYLARSRATAAWAVLVAATVISWWTGAHRIGWIADVSGGVGMFVLLIAGIKSRLVALHFMELKDAPWPLRALIETYCIALFVLLAVTLLLS